MARLTEEQIMSIKEHMCSDEKKLAALYRAKKKPHDECSVSFNEAEERKKQNWEEVITLKTKVRMQRPKPVGVAFEDRIWSMFYDLGFRNLNRDEHLEIKWGDGEGDHKQIDVLAVGEEAIFVVECKAASKLTTSSFKSVIDGIEHYKEGVIRALRQIYGDKKIKFILATDNYRIGEEDTKRMTEKKIFHLNENAYKYVQGLLKSYKSCVNYQFYGMMFKNELISSKRIRVPALKGKMGGFDYYMLSIEPETLLKMGFVLHRTKVNDSMAPTYQRLLSSKRLPVITNFIQKGGYFPNSLIVNFDTTSSRKMKIQFDLAENSSEDSNAQLGMLSIPNAYGIAYIIDGQHRLYGYAGTDYKRTNTIPVVAFENMESREQLQIFMDINENQKAVSKNLRLDLEEDINWESPQVDSRLKALRSSIIKTLAADSGSVLANKISVGEDTSDLNFTPFDNGLLQSSLLPRASKQSYTKDTDVCMYDTQNLDHDKAMNDCKKRVAAYLRECYNYVHQELDEKLFNDFIMCNRGTYAFVALVGSLNKHLIKSGQITQFTFLSDRMSVVKPHLDIFINYLSNLPATDENELRLIRGQQAERTWLCRFQNSIHVAVPEYNPDGLESWLKSQDVGLQQRAKDYSEKIFTVLKSRILEKLQDVYGDTWESCVNETKKECLKRIITLHGDDEDFDFQEIDWTDAIDLNDIKTIIEKHWSQPKEGDTSFVPFKKEFAIQVNESFSSKAEKLAWLSDIIKFTKAISDPKGKKLSPQQVDEMELIYGSLNPEA
ncbi:DGQHR domain-containing protein [uncultured Phocaeicola sp.]|jgi:DNA sulfur modification protein DndB|uniref:DGQHR domain-containing protein n=1 Tax=uncultured Phocaeicola sp. TaxID=990718 RepID=UPI0025AE996D|nr:DGQHR domain-containing protein [uncultured Phocaeicola sp.]